MSAMTFMTDFPRNVVLAYVGVLETIVKRKGREVKPMELDPDPAYFSAQRTMARAFLGIRPGFVETPQAASRMRLTAARMTF